MKGLSAILATTSAQSLLRLVFRSLTDAQLRSTWSSLSKAFFFALRSGAVDEIEIYARFDALATPLTAAHVFDGAVDMRGSGDVPVSILADIFTEVT
jgi:hypothetical protein